MDQIAPSPLRTIETLPPGAPAHPSRVAAGPAPQLSWLKIELLVVDPAYQRDISAGGRANIRRIVSGFRWTRFSPVIVAPVEGGRFAILDGQHRTTAAAMIGIDSVPCQIVFATPGEQAEAFTAINGATTRVHPLNLHRAAVAAGDADALRLQAVAARAGITILPYPKAELHQAPGETLALGTIKDAVRLYGEDVAVLALRCVRETAKNNIVGGLSASIIAATSRLVAAALRAGHEPQALLAFFDHVLLIREQDKARMTDRPKGKAVWSELADRLDRAFAAHLAKGA
ncbi:ParB N-terminal domain-containing protein [Kaistia nematophila]|uniref:ParB N-terminal domain-containing protein n=1 Tax=Kaistia nematophila TaxID=2994654 RepID=A0A9X3E5F3_9HYPH|nr:ParB N-terminal domain-containing protein [Kaistia nematophila]MCX5571463.1 ParB N-terminal domain-containing protein [Kaistia nematophila]